MNIHRLSGDYDMMILLTYDVDFSTDNGKKRLRKVAKLCERYGVRVQNSVFEMLVDSMQLAVLRNEIINLIDIKLDSVRIYKFSQKRINNVEIIGLEKGFKQEETIVI
jgi:CRISPR-associated protein Cas2